jgi:hypothetical protein
MSLSLITHIAPNHDTSRINRGKPKTYKEALAKLLLKHLEKDELGLDEDENPTVSSISRDLYLEDYDDGSGNTDFRVTFRGDSLSSFTLGELPNCCGVTVLQSFLTTLPLKKGFGSLINKIAIAKAKEQGYTLVMGTDLASNRSHKAMLLKNGWSLVDTFVNNRTKNKLNVYTYKINRSKKDLIFDFRES